MRCGETYGQYWGVRVIVWRKTAIMTAMLLVWSGNIKADDDPRQVWKAYRAASAEAISNVESVRRWIDRLSKSADQLAADWPARARILREVGALHGFIGEKKQAIETYELLYEEALQHDDVDLSTAALQNLVSHLGRPSSLDELARVNAMYREYKGTIPNIKGNDDYKRKLLRDAYLEHGEMLVQSERLYAKLSQDETARY